MEYNAIFQHIHQNIRVYPSSKKICIDQWLWKYYCIFGVVRAKESVSEQVWFAPDTFSSSEGWRHPRKIWLFLLSFKPRNSIPSTNTKMLYKYEHIVFFKTGNFILNLVPLSFSYNHTIPKRLSSQSIFPNFLVNWE